MPPNKCPRCGAEVSNTNVTLWDCGVSRNTLGAERTVRCYENELYALKLKVREFEVEKACGKPAPHIAALYIHNNTTKP